MARVAFSQEEADAQLRVLREERGVKDKRKDDAIISSLNYALSVFSDQLYQRSTHFLLELIQNADDNTYSIGVVPTLHLSLYWKHDQAFLLSECNEVGFTFQQLDALLRVGQSTKGLVGGSKGYIGEKGIGFKSAFRVADVLHIASGFYEFKLDRNETVGMILPILSRFPGAHRKPHHSQFLLELNSYDVSEEVREELEDLEPQLLIFLRKLAKIQVSCHGVSKIYKRQTITHDDKFGGETITISQSSIDGNELETDRYIVHRRTVATVHPESRRQGVNSSEVVVAFAIQGRETPVTDTQMAFAFLPIDDFGFRFLIHADFILVASRESIDYSCKWNMDIRDGIKEAFVDAIIRLTRLSGSGDSKALCYSWPKYLSRHSGAHSFWNRLHQDILEALSNEDILRSRENTICFRQPADLFYLPRSYRFEGESLFELKSTRKSHLSFAYDDVHKTLSQIGVRTVSIARLFGDFRQWINEFGTAGLKAQPAEWHRKVSSTFCDQHGLLDSLQKLPIVPLRDGSWVDAITNHVYFTSSDKAEHVPAGINISIVDRDASQDSTRRRFFRFLGLKEYSPRHVCNLILELHQDMSSGYMSRAKEDLIADMVYLFKHRSEIRDHKHLGLNLLLLRGQRTKVRMSSRPGMIKPIYLADQTVKPNIIGKYRYTDGSPFAILSDDYESEISRAQGPKAATEFRNWLFEFEDPKFASVPTLTHKSKLSPEWRFLYEQDVVDLLQVIKYHYKERGLEKAVRDAAPELQVPCLDGVSRRLGSLAVPTPELLRGCPHLDFTDLPVPTVLEWEFLSGFGVLTTCNTRARLWELQELRKLHINHVDKKAVHDIYEALGSNTDAHERVAIKNTFSQIPLVFVTKPKPQWISHKSCVWTAPSPLEQVIKLKTDYDDCGKLFKRILGVKPAGINHVVNELCSLSDKDDAAALKFEVLFSLLGDFHDATSGLDHKQVETLRSASIFPVESKWDDSQDDSTVSLHSVYHSKWYIPDRATLERTFRGKVDMLSLPVEIVRYYSGLFKDLGLEDRFLSYNVEETTETIGMSIRDIPEECALKERVRFIKQLTYKSATTNGDFIMPQIWSVPSIKVIKRLDLVEVSHDNELMTVKESEEVTKIFFRESATQSDQPKITFHLVEYLIAELDIDPTDTNIVNLLISAPLSELPEIMEKNDIPFPEFSEDEESDGESIADEYSDTGSLCEDLEDGMACLNIAATPELTPGRVFEHVERKPLALENDDGDDDDEAEQTNSIFNTNESQHSKLSLRELVPSHQSRAERITRRAEAFVFHEALVVEAPIRNVQSGITSHKQPPRETEDSSRLKDTRRLFHRRQSSGEVSQESFSLGHWASSSTSQNRVSSARNIRLKEIGFLGELFVYNLFQSRLDDWTYENWTSKLRAEAGHPKFTQPEKDYADFTYCDHNGHMKDILYEAGVHINPEWSHKTKFHLEIKATHAQCKDPFFVSQNQLDKIRLFNGDAHNAYLLLRVFNLREGETANIKIFQDLWSLYIGGTLHFRSEQGYSVYELE